MCPQDKITRSSERWNRQRRRMLGPQTRGERWQQSRCGPFDNFVNVKALKAGCWFVGKGLGQRYGCCFWEMERRDLFSSKSCLLHPSQPSGGSKGIQLNSPGLFPQIIDPVPLHLLILRQPFSWQKQLGLNYFPASQSLDNRWLWKHWCVKHFHVL